MGLGCGSARGAERACLPARPGPSREGVGGRPCGIRGSRAASASSCGWSSRLGLTWFKVKSLWDVPGRVRMRHETQAGPRETPPSRGKGPSDDTQELTSPQHPRLAAWGPLPRVLTPGHPGRRRGPDGARRYPCTDASRSPPPRRRPHPGDPGGLEQEEGGAHADEGKRSERRASCWNRAGQVGVETP